ncbi:hypothetical protein C2845_PM02G18210 [Panicum miliaceum]|uniref:F-box domain-containing protein n=1 Tax=Panicum miliaceum TaxID=4540 RepID=A0A3L6S835_PANMI|nr:hypothetical protein C2845_PM02G18210 [Panicum miliaceum]
MAEATGAAGVPGAACRINTLPDDLLPVISYLDSREAVQHVCAVTPWCDLWRSVPRINASCEEFHGTDGTDEECSALFKKFLNRFLFLMLRNRFFW